MFTTTKKENFCFVLWGFRRERGTGGKVNSGLKKGSDNFSFDLLERENFFGTRKR